MVTFLKKKKILQNAKHTVSAAEAPVEAVGIDLLADFLRGAVVQHLLIGVLRILLINGLFPHRIALPQHFMLESLYLSRDRQSAKLVIHIELSQLDLVLQEAPVYLI